MPYDPALVQPMREELTRIGFEELMDTDTVDTFFAEKSGTALLVINSVCGCAAGMARPSVKIALESGDKRPDRIATVFAGQDIDATKKARGYFADYPPSSPSMALFKGGEVVEFFPRHRIEGREAMDVAGDLVKAFEEHCEG